MRTIPAYLATVAMLLIVSPAFADDTDGICTAEEMKQPALAAECDALAQAKRSTDALAKSMESLRKALDSASEAMRKMEEQDRKLLMKIMPGKDI